jgi:HEAT repeat protein
MRAPTLPAPFVSLSRVWWAATFAIVATGSLAIGQSATPPDFTKGDAIPEKARHDWNLGATGLRGWMFTEDFSTKTARQIKVTAVAEGSPAHGLVQVGDVILGVGGKPFSFDPRTEFGKALTIAESEKGAGKLALTRWRDGKQEEVTIPLPVLGSYSATAPFDCVKSKLILEKGCATLAKQIAEPSYNPDPIVRSINALALLAGGNKEHLPLVKREAQRAAEYAGKDYRTWYFGYVMMLAAEYKLATGDDSVTSGLRRLAVETAKGQSAVGSWGHDFARPDGRLKGYGMMNAPGLPLTTSLVLARAAGVDDPEIPAAIERSLRLLRFYIGKGSIPYGDHAPWMEGHEDNGKCGMAAVLFNLTNEDKGAEFFARMSLSAHGGERDCGHTGNFFNVAWAMPGVALSGPHATGAWMNEFGAWYFDLARRWDGSFAHLGPPEPDFDSYHGWDATGTYLLAYAAPLKNLYILGKRSTKVSQLSAVEAEMHIAPGRGWSQTDRTSVYQKMSDDELIEMLGSWSPILRGRAGKALSMRKEPPVDRVIALLDSPSLEARLGACQAIAEMRGKAAAAVPALRKALGSDDLWLRVQSAEALANIGKPAAEAVPELLELLAQGPTKEDPRAMQQRFISMALLGSRTELLGPSLEGVDRKQLDRAVRSGLQNEDGWCRSNVANLYSRLSYEEIKPLLPAILQAVVKSAPSGEMFAEDVRVAGLRVMATHHIKEGIRACAQYLRDQNPWASEIRTPEILKILETYGAHASTVIPQLESLAADYADGEPDFPMHLSQQKAAAVRESIARIKASTERPELKSIR